MGANQAVDGSRTHQTPARSCTGDTATHPCAGTITSPNCAVHHLGDGRGVPARRREACKVSLVVSLPSRMWLPVHCMRGLAAAKRSRDLCARSFEDGSESSIRSALCFVLIVRYDDAHGSWCTLSSSSGRRKRSDVPKFRSAFGHSPRSRS